MFNGRAAKTRTNIAAERFVPESACVFYRLSVPVILLQTYRKISEPENKITRAQQLIKQNKTRSRWDCKFSYREYCTSEAPCLVLFYCRFPDNSVPAAGLFYLFVIVNLRLLSIRAAIHVLLPLQLIFKKAIHIVVLFYSSNNTSWQFPAYASHKGDK